MSKFHDMDPFVKAMRALGAIANPGAFARRNPLDVGGGVTLSVQAGEGYYSTPETSGLPIHEYEDVEIGVLGPDGLTRPSALGVEGFDHLFEDGRSPVAGHVAQDDLKAMTEAFMDKHGSGK